MQYVNVGQVGFFNVLMAFTATITTSWSGDLLLPLGVDVSAPWPTSTQSSIDDKARRAHVLANTCARPGSAS